nr:ribonuclease H-like domain-containing protein [Tanacetum cinerariifolium]
MAFNSSSSFSSDNEVSSCLKACTKAYATLQSHYDKLTADFRKSQFDVISYKAGLEFVEVKLLVYQQNESVFEEDIKLLKLEVQLRDNTLVVLRQNLEKAKQERDDLKLKLEKFQTSSKNLIKTPRSSVHTIETSIPAANHKTAFPKPKSHGTSRNRKACFVCKSLTHLIKDCDYYDTKVAQRPARNHAQWGNNQQYVIMTLLNPQRHVVPTTVLTKSKLVPITDARPVTAADLKTHMTRPSQAKTIVTKPHSPPRGNINRCPSPKACTFPPKVIAAKAPMANPQHALKDKGVIDSGCSMHITWNMSYMTGNLDFDDVYFVKELKFNLISVSQMCDKKNSVVFIDTKCIILSPEFKPPDENQVLLRVPRENNMYNVDLKNIIPSGDLTCLFAKATLDESNLWHRKLGYINFKTMNKLEKDPLGNFDGKDDEGFLVGYSVSKNNLMQKKQGRIMFNNMCFFLYGLFGSKNPQNTDDDDAAFGGKKLDFEGRKPESEVHVSSSKDITYSDDEEAVGAEADFTNLETIITVSPILTTRVHKDHPVTQIIEPKRVHQALKDPSWIKAMQEELLQFKMQKVWVLVDFPNGKRAIGTKWVFRNKKDERGIIVRNKA